MPYKDPQRNRDYDRDYQRANKEKLAAYRRQYRQDHREEIEENNQRRIYVGHAYLCTVGMTQKQREQFQKEVNDGATQRP